MKMDLSQIKEILPHREPFLFVDEVVLIDVGERIVAKRKFTEDDYFFKGHFPGNPVVPGVILAEAMAQVGGILIYASNLEEFKGKLPALIGLDSVKFRKPVLPGDEVQFEVLLIRSRKSLWKMEGIASIGDKKVAQAVITASLF